VLLGYLMHSLRGVAQSALTLVAPKPGVVTACVTHGITKPQSPGGVLKTRIANGEIAPVVVTLSKHIWCCGAGSVTNCITICIAEPVL